ncbi:MAG: amidohydrolase [Actinomycetota bacterium]
MTSTLFTGGAIHTFGAPEPSGWLLVDDGVVVGSGARGDEPAAERRIDLAGASLVPGFCDAHVHLPATGLAASGMDLRDVHEASTITAAFARRAGTGGVLFGGNFEDPLDRPLTRSDLDAAVGDRPALLARADMHSCIVSTALLASLGIDGSEGVDRDATGRPTGYLREQAAGAAWRWFDAHLPAVDQRRAIEAAVGIAYSRGVTCVHEMYVVEWRGWGSLDRIREVAEEVALGVALYVATSEVGRVKEMGLERVGGDLFLDGSFGSYTAWLSRPYTSTPPSGAPEAGMRYRTDDELADVFRAAQVAGMQCGVHAIGDAAIDQALRGWEAVAEEVGLEAVRALGHRIEHFECATDDHIRRAVRLGLRISIQPGFDRLWGGQHGMYARRIGWERAASMNRFGTMTRAGLTVGAGSDSTVTPLDPLFQMAALRSHHVPEERLAPREALYLHTAGAHALDGSVPGAGSLAPGTPADLAVLDRDPLAVSDEELVDTAVLGTWVAGTRVWPPAEAEAR